MSDVTVSANVDSLMGSADFAAFRTLLSLTALATTTPGANVATALGVAVGSAGAFVVLNGAGGTPSSLTLTNATGFPFATGGTGIVASGNGGTGVNNGASFTFTCSNFPLLFTLTGSTTLTLPSTGTLATLAGAEALTNKSYNGMTLSSSSGTFTLTNAKTFAVTNTLTLSGTDGTTMTFPPASASLGYLGIPQNSQSAAYTTVLADAGKEIFHPVGDNSARTFTIDSNANVAYPIGTVIKFKNMAAAASTIAITSDTMTLLPAGTTGSRTLAQYGEAIAEKITSTSWTISGNSALT